MQSTIGVALGYVREGHELIRSQLAERDFGTEHMDARLALPVYPPGEAVVFKSVLVFPSTLVGVNAGGQFGNVGLICLSQMGIGGDYVVLHTRTYRAGQAKVETI